MHANGWGRRTRRMFDSFANDLRVSFLLSRFCDVDEVATSTTLDVWAQRITPIGTRFENPHDSSPGRPCVTLNRGNDTIAWHSGGNEHAQSILETTHASTTCRECIDEQNVFFGGGR